MTTARSINLSQKVMDLALALREQLQKELKYPKLKAAIRFTQDGEDLLFEIRLRRKVALRASSPLASTSSSSEPATSNGSRKQKAPSSGNGLLRSPGNTPKKSSK